MSQYLLQLQEDQMTLQALLEQQRAALEKLETADDEAMTPEELRPSLRLTHQIYIYILERTLSTVSSMTEYLSRDAGPH